MLETQQKARIQGNRRVYKRLEIHVLRDHPQDTILKKLVLEPVAEGGRFKFLSLDEDLDQTQKLFSPDVEALPAVPTPIYDPGNVLGNYNQCIATTSHSKTASGRGIN